MQNSLQKPFQFLFLFLDKITKIKLKSFECPKSIRNHKKYIWSVKPLVYDSSVPSAHRPRVLYSRLTDFWIVLPFFQFSVFGYASYAIFYRQHFFAFKNLKYHNCFHIIICHSYCHHQIEKTFCQLQWKGNVTICLTRRQQWLYASSVTNKKRI